jgi:tetratricopeptide (TPR) repeat protein
MDEIAKLEALYASNPDGRVFTHLAEAYRKAGQFERARTILEQGLTKHPAYASAHVVLGRVFIDLNQADEAAESFRRVLQLDPHNLVALRSLGDLARAAGRNAEAVGYFEELRHQDPSNEELEGIINELLASPGPGVETTQAPAQSQPAVPSAPAMNEAAPQQVAPPAASEPATELPDFSTMEPDFGELVPPDVELDWANTAPENDNGLPGDLAGFAEMNANQSATSTDTFGDVDLNQPATDMPSDLGGFDVDLGEPAAVSDNEATLDFGEFGMVSEPPPEAPALPEAAPEPEPWAAEAALVPAPPPAAPEPAPAASATPSTPAPEGELVTETMAELYRNQGLHERAAEVYRALLKQRPDDPQLQAKLAEIEALTRIVPADEEVDSPWTSSAAAGSSAPTPYAWAEETQAEVESGPSVSEYFRTLLAWKPAQSSFAPAPEVEEQPVEILELDEPIQTADEPLFSEPVAEAPPTHSIPLAGNDELMPWEEPAPPQAPAPVTASAADTPDDVFDEWFGASEPAAPAAAAPAAPGLADTQDAEASGTDGEDEDDLEMFRSWLQSLKK